MKGQTVHVIGALLACLALTVAPAAAAPDKKAAPAKKAGPPMALALLVNGTLSYTMELEPDMPTAYTAVLRGYSRLVAGLGPHDVVTVDLYDHAKHHSKIPPSDDHAATAKAIEALKPDSTTDPRAPALLAATTRFAQRLGGAPSAAVPMHRVLLIVTDGKDIGLYKASDAERAAAAKTLRDTGVAIYVLGLTLDDPEPLARFASVIKDAGGSYRDVSELQVDLDEVSDIIAGLAPTLRALPPNERGSKK